MMRFTLTLCFAISLIQLPIHAQNCIALQHRSRPQVTEQLLLDMEYNIKTNDTTYSSEIFYPTDSSLSILRWKDSGRDTSYLHPISGAKTPLHRLYLADTTIILYSNIRYIQRRSLKNTGWLEPFLWMGVGSILGIGLLPVVAIEDGSKGVKDWAIFEGILLGAGGSAVFLATRKTTYDLKDEWKIVFQRK